MSMNITGMNNANMMQQVANVQRDENTTQNFQAIFENAIEEGDSEQLREAAVQMEGFFINMMLTEMRRTVPDSRGIFQRSQAEKMMQEMLDVELANDISESGGLGIADMIYNQISRERRN